MTLDEAIEHAQEIADKSCDQCAEDHRQLTEWLKELKKLRRLGWHPASKLPNMGEEVVTWVNHKDGAITVSRGVYVGWPEEIINKLWWCYPPKEE